MTFTPKTPVASSACETMVTTLVAFGRTKIWPTILNAGQYHCVATSVTVGASAVPASMEGRLDIVSGSNAPQS
jgi:hypothetical protein